MSNTGELCRGQCDKYGGKYFYCSLFGQDRDYGGGYCSPDNQTTKHGEKCTDACDDRGYRFYWCNTETSWDYCSPAYRVGMLGFESVTAAGEKLWGQIVMLAVISTALLKI